MRSIVFTSVFLCCCQIAICQLHVGMIMGTANYLGDLNDRPFHRPRPMGAITLSYELTERFILRAGVIKTFIDGADRYGLSQWLKDTRNLSFESHLHELSLVAEHTAFNLNNIRWSPYVFAGVALYNYNPYAFDTEGNKVYLRPLSTEGQGLPEYPDRKPYRLTDLAIPVGIGIRYNLSETFRIGAEITWRKTFTDHLDDVSGYYVDPMVLRNRIGEKAVEMSYRAPEVGGPPEYPGKTDARGNPNRLDAYYFTGLHLTYHFLRRDSRTNGSQLKCPSFFP